MTTHYDYFIAYTEQDSQLVQTLKADVNTVEEFVDCIEVFGTPFQKSLTEVESEVNLSDRVLLLLRKEAYTNIDFFKLCAYAVNRLDKNQIFPYITDESFLPISWNSIFSGIRIITSEICHPQSLAMYALDEKTPRQMEGELNYDKGNELYDEGRIDEAIFLYEKAAKLDYDYAQCELADMYFWGKDVVENKETAFMWYSKAANNGNLYAQYSLGYCYENGIGAPENINEAIYWYNEAANEGYEDAKEALNRLYK